MGGRFLVRAGVALMGLVGTVVGLRAASDGTEQGGAGYLPAAASSPTPAPATPVTPPATPPVPTSGWVATLAAPTGWSASPGGPVAGTLSAANPFGGPQTVAVVGAPDRGGWLHVELPVRPNGSTGWIPAASAHLTWTPYSIDVSLSARTLTVWRGSQVVLRSPVAVGAARTPTPPDHTYVWELVEPDNPAGSYGPYIFGLAEFSDAFTVFNGGDAQIGIHGSDEPWSIGQAASNGCVRLPNDVVSRMVGVLSLGTPVAIA